MSPLRALVALLGILTAWLGPPRPVARLEAAGPTPPAPAVSSATLLRDLEILHLRAHAAADRLAEWDVGVHPVAPRRVASR